MAFWNGDGEGGVKTPRVFVFRYFKRSAVPLEDRAVLRKGLEGVREENSGVFADGGTGGSELRALLIDVL